MSQGGPALVVNQISNSLMGHAGGILAIIGVVILPALFMTVVVTTFLGYAKIGFTMPMPVATTIGIVAAAVCLVLFYLKIKPADAH